MTLLTESTAVDIAQVDTKLTVAELYKGLEAPSLGRQIFSVLPQTGPVAGVFALRRTDDNHAELLRNDAEVLPTDPIDTGITQEAADDIRAQYGESANLVISTLLRGVANNQENTRTLEFLASESELFGDLVLSDKLNAIVIKREIAKLVQEIVIKINSRDYMTYRAVCVLPAKYAAAFMATADDFTDNSAFSIGRVGMTNYFVNPDPDATDAYVMLLDNSTLQSSGYFGDYKNDIVQATDSDTGQDKYFIYNRYAITASPLHSKNKMFYHFTVS